MGILKFKTLGKSRYGKVAVNVGNPYDCFGQYDIKDSVNGNLMKRDSTGGTWENEDIENWKVCLGW